MTLDFSDVKLLVVGDVCEDVLIAGPATRLTRETPGLPIIDVETVFRVEGGAAVGYRQAKALGADAILIATGRPATKSRLFALMDGCSREVARWDQPWPAQRPEDFGQLWREVQRPGQAMIYYQVRPGRPLESISRVLRRFKGLSIADAHHPAYFAGFDGLKINMANAWEALQGPRPAQVPERACEVAAMFCETYGYRFAVVTMGRDGYAASVEGSQIMQGAVSGGRRQAGAGDVFSATLSVALAANLEVREALTVANIAAGKSTQREEHLGTVTIEELREVYF